MDDAVLGLVWVTCVCIVGHMASAFYFQKILSARALEIDDKITEIDKGLAMIAQYVGDKLENLGSQTALDWGAIISQIFSQKQSPNNDYNRSLNGQFNGEAQQQQEEEQPETLEGTLID